MKKHTTSPPPTTRIRVLPGTCLPISSPPPPPPSSPPPQPVHLCKIAIIGDPSSGKSSLVNKFLLRKSADVNSEGGVQWCNASATSLGTFGSAVGASSLGVTGGVESTLAEYCKKDIALKRRVVSGDESENDTTCVRAQVWDVNVPQSALIINGQGENNGHDNSNDHDTSPEQVQSSSNTINSASSSYISSSSLPTTKSQQYHNSSSDNLANLAPLLPLLKRLNVIIIACQCPTPPTTNTTQQFSSASSNASYHSQMSRRSVKNDQMEWAELNMLEKQIELWIKFIRGNISMDGGAKSNGGSCGNSSHKNNNINQTPYTIAIMLTFADLAITEYSPKEWMRLSVKMKEVCDKFGIHSWRMGTCVSSAGLNGAEKSDEHESAQYGMFQRMAQQQQQMMEEMEDSVEALFIDLILTHLDST